MKRVSVDVRDVLTIERASEGATCAPCSRVNVHEPARYVLARRVYVCDGCYRKFLHEGKQFVKHANVLDYRAPGK